MHPLLGLLLLLPSTLAYNRLACQHPSNTTPSTACPPNTILVGRTQTFRTIQSAILSLPQDHTPYTILIQPGTYTEQLNITRAGPLTLLGVTSSPNTHEDNTVKVVWKAATGTKETGNRDNAFTATLTVAPSLDAALTGAGPTGHLIPSNTPFGNTDFRAYNIDFSNEYKPQAAGPSLAVSIGMANAGFYFCGVRSWQDTVYVGKEARAYFYKGEVAGAVDFLYGFGTLWVQGAKVALRGCGGGIAAWKGRNGTVPTKFGVYVRDSVVGKAKADLNLKGKCSLGRPWNELHRSIFAKCYMDDSIMPAGYTKWSPNDNRINSKTLMAEYCNTGPGAGGRKGTQISKQLSEEEYEPYSTVEKVFRGQVSWIDRSPESKETG